MKKLLLATIVAALPLLSYAQKEPGTITVYPRMGVNWSKFTHDKIYYYNNECVNSKYRTGFTGGAEVQYQFSNNIAASAGALYSHQGTNFDDIPDIDGEPVETPQFKTDNILVPVLLIATSRIGLDFKLGLQPEFMFNSHWKNVFNKVNLSMPVGIAYEWNHIAIDVRYNVGLTKIYKDTDHYDTSRGSTFLITLGYGFDF